MTRRVGAGRAGVRRFTVILQERQPDKVSRPGPGAQGVLGFLVVSVARAQGTGSRWAGAVRPPPS